MSSRFLKSRWFFYSLLLFITVLYWCFDSAWSYLSYERNLNSLLFMVPSSFFDTFVLKVSPYQTGSRLGVLLLLLFSGTLLIELGKRNEKVSSALVESEKRYQYLMDHANVGTCVVQNGVFEIPNPKFLEITGYPEEELTRLVFTELVHPDDRGMVMDWYGRAVLGEQPITDQPFQIITKNGNIKWLQLSTTQIVWRGAPAQFSIIHDVSRRKKWEETRNQAKKMEAIGLLAGGVAHDLNNILSGIVSYPELLLHLLPDDSPLRGHVQTMHDAGIRAAAVVADLLTVARGVASQREILDLNRLAGDFLNSPEYQVLQKRFPEVSVISRCPQEKVLVLASEIHIQKSVMNLMFNAHEAIEEEGGAVTISTGMENLGDQDAQALNLVPGSYAWIRVSDTGPGISPEQKEHIFEPFYTRKTMGRSGTGLGLTVVWNTVVDHNGAIDIKSSEKGTAFTLYFPAEISLGESREDKSDSDIYVTCRGEKKRILLVDDEAQQREIGCEFLGFLEYSVDVVSSGEEAVEYLGHSEVDLVILDMIMDPGMNGRETYEQIIQVKPGQKALIVTGYAAHDEIARAQELGVADLLKKPYTLKQLAGAVDAALHRV